MSFDSLISHMENRDVCYLSLCNPFCCIMHMHLGSCLLTPFLKIYQSNISNIFSLFLTFLQGLTLLHHLQLHLASASFQMVQIGRAHV